MCPSGVDVSSSTLRFLEQQLRRHRRAIGSRWRRLSAGRQALLTLAHLRMGHTYAQLDAGFGIGTTTAHRYVAEAVGLLPRASCACRSRTAGLRRCGREAARYGRAFHRIGRFEPTSQVCSQCGVKDGPKRADVVDGAGQGR